MNAPSSKNFDFSCPACLRPIKAGLKAVGKSLPCPGCGKTITVPTPENTQWDAVHEPPPVDEYGVAAPVEIQKHTPVIAPIAVEPCDTDLDDDNYRPVTSSYEPGSASGTKFDEDKLVITERRKLPPHPMTTEIFAMFSDPSSIIWFITLGVGFAITIAMITLPILAFAGAPMRMLYLILAAAGCGFGFIFGLGMFFFSSNCFLCILQDSAAGNRTVESWPDQAGGGFSATGISYVSLALFYSNGLGLALAWPLRYQGIDWLPILLVTCFFTFPFFLVSAMEVGSPMTPISMNLVRSFSARFTAWFTFYVETAIICAIGLGTALLLIKSLGLNPGSLTITCAVVLGPLFTFLIFIYFRLLGRLLWVCDDWFRSLEPKEEDAEEEEEWEEIPIR